MTTINELYQNHINAQQILHDKIIQLKDRVVNLCDINELPYYLETLPTSDEEIFYVRHYGDEFVTEWEYNDPYEEVMSTETAWRIPLSWFTMDDSEILKHLHLRNDIAYKQELTNLTNHANKLGYKITKKYA